MVNLRAKAGADSENRFSETVYGHFDRKNPWKILIPKKLRLFLPRFTEIDLKQFQIYN